MQRVFTLTAPGLLRAGLPIVNRAQEILHLIWIMNWQGNQHLLLSSRGFMMLCNTVSTKASFYFSCVQAPALLCCTPCAFCSSSLDELHPRWLHPWLTVLCVTTTEAHVLMSPCSGISHAPQYHVLKWNRGLPLQSSWASSSSQQLFSLWFEPLREKTKSQSYLTVSVIE